MSEAQQEIAVRLGSAFAAIADRFLPAVTEAVARSKKKITFGATAECQINEGVVTLKLIPHEPKIPTETMDAMHFVLKRDAAGQLSFLFDGSLKAMKEAADALLAESDRPSEDDHFPAEEPQPPPPRQRALIQKSPALEEPDGSGDADYRPGDNVQGDRTG